MPKGKRRYLPSGLTVKERTNAKLRKKLSSCIKQVEKKACPKSALRKNGTYRYSSCKVNPVAVCRSSVSGKYNPHKLDFPGEEGYDTKISVFVPDTTGVSTRISGKEHLRRAKETEEKVRDIFGGSTSVKGLGTWKSKLCPGDVCEDNLLIVEAGMTLSDWKKHDKEMKKYLKKKRLEWGQECITFNWEVVSQNHPYEGMHFLCGKN